MKKPIYIFSTIIVIIILLLLYFFRVYIFPIKYNINFKKTTPSKEGKLVLHFIDKNLTGSNGGIYTNYLNISSKGEETKGHSVLSESEGLQLLYSVSIGDKKRFDKHFDIIQNKMLLNNGLVTWRIDTSEKKGTSSASIDDLRIAKAYIYAYTRWGDFKYKLAAIKLSNSLLKNSTQDNILIDFHDNFGKSNLTTICYIDINTMNLLSKINSKWDLVSKNCLPIVKNARISYSLPLFKKNYSLINKSYSKETQCETLYSLIVWENLSEAGMNTDSIISWLENQMNTYGKIFSLYDVNTGKPLSDIESTSIYSIASQIAKSKNKVDLYKKIIDRMNCFQIKNINSEIYGAFGDEKSKYVYSFDNLNALLSLLTSK